MQSYNAQYSTPQCQNFQSNFLHQPNGALTPVATPPGIHYPPGGLGPGAPPQLPPPHTWTPQPTAPCNTTAHAPVAQSPISRGEVHSSGGYSFVSSQSFAQYGASTPHVVPPYTIAPTKPPAVEYQCNVGAAAPLSCTVYSSPNDLPPHLKQALGQTFQNTLPQKIKDEKKRRQPQPVQPLITAPQNPLMPVQVVQPQIKIPVVQVNPSPTQMVSVQTLQASPTRNVLPTVSPILPTQISPGMVLSPPTNQAFVPPNQPLQTSSVGQVTTPTPIPIFPSATPLSRPNNKLSTLDTICKVTEIGVNVLEGVETLTSFF